MHPYYFSVCFWWIMLQRVSDTILFKNLIKTIYSILRFGWFRCKRCNALYSDIRPQNRRSIERILRQRQAEAEKGSLKNQIFYIVLIRHLPRHWFPITRCQYTKEIASSNLSMRLKLILVNCGIGKN